MSTERPTTTVRITSSAHKTLRELAERDDLSLTDELSKIVEEQRRQRLFEQADASYQALREDETTWEDLQSERDELEGNLMDGLEDDE